MERTLKQANRQILGPFSYPVGFNLKLREKVVEWGREKSRSSALRPPFGRKRRAAPDTAAMRGCALRSLSPLQAGWAPGLSGTRQAREGGRRETQLFLRTPRGEESQGQGRLGTGSVTDPRDVPMG